MHIDEGEGSPLSSNPFEICIHGRNLKTCRKITINFDQFNVYDNVCCCVLLNSIKAFTVVKKSKAEDSYGVVVSFIATFLHLIPLAALQDAS